ncbi:aromatic ring hydroxylase [Candidatus Roizmanbacteria bacterium CG22_combo_CG10-13_8_21_14_all_38_20]|uniref:Aromatic ring hydroxylase n=1 Tax=Candidatus Roizmanbacteria bacterium CG22_combo_CG10-13_8_21_14_all_38_20 TaxID=1974862 RepID=A0A2H0BVV0_9BACT|nr:DUF59 domain-containing protein [Candidatus Microgenomates bacterium]PIP61812.1 MAG: aromatic ring hydroxylase [Candidatus Roizmanbacteria bacterium CG22_combo_CG10-13_8_21_14_all_38_20]PJC31657.1 MAG: aromatic ring hydroxylase [Candidatus Roizmanbacteria bacterium CG_4_9_14_0_2_um_filter_38_17]
MTKGDITKILKTIPDPELGVSIYDLGLIYDIKIKGTKVTVVMTLTTMGCPLFSEISDPIKNRVGNLKGVSEVKIELTFDPLWEPDKMSKKAKLELGFV